MDKIIRELYNACMAAQGAYKALKLVGADKYLPGYEQCVEQLYLAIAMTNKAMGKN